MGNKHIFEVHNIYGNRLENIYGKLVDLMRKIPNKMTRTNGQDLFLASLFSALDILQMH